MNKKCIICGKQAKFVIKGTNDYYCEDCAKENFSDLSLLVSLEELAKEFKKHIVEKMKSSLKEENIENENLNE
jgi:hypothetical protein